MVIGPGCSCLRSTMQSHQIPKTARQATFAVPQPTLLEDRRKTVIPPPQPRPSLPRSIGGRSHAGGAQLGRQAPGGRPHPLHGHALRRSRGSGSSPSLLSLIDSSEFWSCRVSFLVVGFVGSLQWLWRRGKNQNS
jgi:hypothetical protein